MLSADNSNRRQNTTLSGVKLGVYSQHFVNNLPTTMANTVCSAILLEH